MKLDLADMDSAAKTVALPRLRRGMWLAAAVCTIAMVVGGCAGPHPTTRGPTPAANVGTTDVAPTSHISRDQAGAYICVLRRGDDLAALRREVNGGA